MKKQVILSQSAPAPIGPYSQAIRAGSFLFCSGQIPLDPLTGQLVPGDIALQTEQSLKNLEAVLTAAGAGWANVVKTTIFLKSIEDFPIVNQIYAQVLGAGVAPARSTVEVSRLPRDAKVEIEAIAVLE